jgi:Tol biopolymer transport system component
MRAFKTTLEVIAVTLFMCLWMSCNKTNPVKPLCPSLRIVALSPYGSPVWHPSGGFIGFNYTPLKQIILSYDDRGCLTDVRYEFELDSSGFWLIDADGAQMRRVLPYGLGEPDWSLNGEWIAFETGAQIYKMRFTGTAFDTATLTQLTFEGRNFFPSWSPDGEWVAYSNTIGDTVGVWISPTDGSGIKSYFSSGGQPDWFPDGQRLLYGAAGIWIETIDHSSKIQIYSDRINCLGEPKISPDGGKIAFLLQAYCKGLIQLYLMNADGSGLRQLTTEGVGEDFSWSPDSKEIVYLSYRFTDFSYKNGTLWIINIETGAKRQLTFNYPP